MQKVMVEFTYVYEVEIPDDATTADAEAIALEMFNEDLRADAATISHVETTWLDDDDETEACDACDRPVEFGGGIYLERVDVVLCETCHAKHVGIDVYYSHAREYDEPTGANN